MPAPADPHKELEALFERTMRDVAPRQAPPTLLLRVVDALERRAALPWWRRSFVQWPLAARSTFLIASLGALMLMSWNGPHAGLAALPWWQDAALLSALLRQLSVPLTNVIPMAWLYSACGVVALFYMILFGLGAVAYRTLWLRPLTNG